VREAKSHEALFIEEAHGSAVSSFDKRTKCHGEVVFLCGFFEVFIGGLSNLMAAFSLCQLGRELKGSVGFARLKEFISQAIL